MSSPTPSSESPPGESPPRPCSSGSGSGSVEIWLRLARTDLSARRLHQLIEAYGGPARALGATPRELMDLGMNAGVAQRFVEAATGSIRRELAIMESYEITPVPHTDPGYPAALLTLYDPPAVLFVRGELSAADAFAIAIVGSRRATGYGRGVAERLAKELAEVGFTVVSGAARGVDTAAHVGALAAPGRTLAVLGCGVDVAYPASNRSLLERVARSGAVLSEFAPGTQPDAWRFPARNRIISGLSKGVVVVESPEASGTLITVNYALEQGREVFAVPGSVETGLNAGCHRLLREGACLVERAADVLEAFGMAGVEPKAGAPAPELTGQQQRLLDIVGFAQKRADELIAETGLSPAEVNADLMMLEIDGLVRKLPGGAYVRTSLV